MSFSTLYHHGTAEIGAGNCFATACEVKSGGSEGLADVKRARIGPLLAACWIEFFHVAL